ncbi:hypothetical protein R5R35_013653 [Gryllus longicercus]|uniref:SAM domain-containing protein n=1 Tax=Gryllus longicercus TaxID=2509291 RepID=A0AAN9Z508_9ORTH
MAQTSVLDWTVREVAEWLLKNGHGKYVKLFCDDHCIDGKALILLTESDIRNAPLSIQVMGDVKHLSASIRRLQLDNQQCLLSLGYDPGSFFSVPGSSSLGTNGLVHHYYSSSRNEGADLPLFMDSEQHHSTPPLSEDGRATKLQPEVWKALISLGYLFVVTWITAFVMVVVHDRVPDMKKYPPLPDIFLDNVPHIPWAFHMCEVTGTLLLFIWLIVLTFHKHRFILLRRFFALSGTVFLLRCVTMLITSLSVPGTHLQCNPRTLDSEVRKYGELWAKIQHAYIIWRGAGMSIQGVRTCGDYMFSGHTVALTMLNFFITEYTPRHLYFVHTFTWLLNMFGIFFILSAHEHYSIDVFVAFYITSRLFLYYHTLANNQALMQRDSNRTRVWFPLFSFFESSVDGIVPNEYESPVVPIRKLLIWIKECAWKFISPTVSELRQARRISNRRSEFKSE